MNKKAMSTMEKVVAIFLALAGLVILLLAFMPGIFDIGQSSLDIIKECPVARPVQEYINDITLAMQEAFNDYELAISVDSEFKACEEEGNFNDADIKRFDAETKSKVETAYLKFVELLVKDEAFKEAKAVVKEYKKRFGAQGTYYASIDGILGSQQSLQENPPVTGKQHPTEYIAGFHERRQKHEEQIENYYQAKDIVLMIEEYMKILEEARISLTGIEAWGGQEAYYWSVSFISEGESLFSILNQTESEQYLSLKTRMTDAEKLKQGEALHNQFQDAYKASRFHP